MTTDESNELRIKVAVRLGVVCARCKGTGAYMKFGRHEWSRVLYQQRSNSCKGQKPTACDHVTLDENNPYFRLLPEYPTDERTRKEMLAVMSEDEIRQMAQLIVNNPPTAFKRPSLLNEIMATLFLDQQTFCQLWIQVMGDKPQ